MELNKETQPFLDSDESSSSVDWKSEPQIGRSTRRFRTWTLRVASHVTVVVLTLLALRLLFQVQLVKKSSAFTADRTPLTYSPLTPGLRYKVDRPPADYWANDLYFGKPGHESEKAWNKLIRPHGLKLHPHEAQRLNITNTAILPNGEYVTLLSVYHNLHCLRRLRQTLQAEHYYPHLTLEELEEEKHHTMHCLESVRTSIMCRADLTPLRFYWSGRIPHDLSASPNVERECLDWDSLQEIRHDRIYDTKLLFKHHKHGDEA